MKALLASVPGPASQSLNPVDPEFSARLIKLGRQGRTLETEQPMEGLLLCKKRDFSIAGNVAIVCADWRSFRGVCFPRERSLEVYSGFW